MVVEWSLPEFPLVLVILVENCLVKFSEDVKNCELGELFCKCAPLMKYWLTGLEYHWAEASAPNVSLLVQLQAIWTPVEYPSLYLSMLKEYAQNTHSEEGQRRANS